METVIAIAVGNKVRITSDDQFNNAEGVILDLNSASVPQDGPIAIYFGFGNEEELTYYMDRDWKGPEPTPENYTDCPRVFHFTKDQLTVIEEYSMRYRATLLYPGCFQHSYNRPKAAFEPGKQPCSLLSCESGKPATEKSLMNSWGHIYEVYTCEECHKKYNGTCGDPAPSIKS